MDKIIERVTVTFHGKKLTELMPVITAFYHLLVFVPFKVKVSIGILKSIENSEYIYNYFREVCIENYNEANIVVMTTTKYFAMLYLVSFYTNGI